MMIIPLVKGIAVGLGASIPLGPLGILCVQKTLSKGRNSGLFTGLGASASDTFYAGISLLGLAFVQNIIDNNTSLVMVVGGIIIMLIGLRIYLKNPIKQIRQKHTNNKHFEDFFEGLFMTVTNPGAIVLILGLFAAVGIDVTDPQTSKGVVFETLGGVFIGSACWWFTLSTTINVFRKRFRLKQLITINKISGIAIFALGLISLFTGIFEVLKAYLVSTGK